MVQARGVAHRIWIKQVHDGRYVKQEGWNPNYVDINGKQVSRVNVLASVVGKFSSEDGNYGALTLDDGTDTIRIKAFGPDVSKIKPVRVGAIVRLVGKLKQYNEETYLSPEVVREVDDPNWLIVSKLELGRIEPRRGDVEEGQKTLVDEEPEGAAAEEVIPVEPRQEESVSAKMLGIISELDKGEGADTKKIIEKSGLDTEDAKSALAGLLASGEVFEPKKGKLKVLS